MNAFWLKLFTIFTQLTIMVHVAARYFPSALWTTKTFAAHTRCTYIYLKIRSFCFLTALETSIGFWMTSFANDSLVIVAAFHLFADEWEKELNYYIFKIPNKLQSLTLISLNWSLLLFFPTILLLYEWPCPPPSRSSAPLKHKHP